MIPTITIDFDSTTKLDYLVVVPGTISIISDLLPGKKVGTVKIHYAKEQTSEEDDDYHEDEQLYAAVRQREFDSKFPNEELTIFAHTNFWTIVVPHFTNIITTNLLAKKLAEICPSTWITLAPCSINNNQSLNKMSSEKLNIEAPKLDTLDSKSNTSLANILLAVPTLKPPHFITGIAASITSQNVSKCMLTLVLNSEGQPGFEKSDNDAIIDAAYVLGEILLDGPLRELYLKKVSLSVRKFNGYSNSGMYI